MTVTPSKKILIVEDERPIARALQLKLKNSGFEPESVFNGEGALALMQEKAFDLVLLDLMMPKVGGFAVLEELRKRGDTTPVIIISNLNQPEDIKKAKEIGAVDFFIKSDTPLANIVDNVKKNLDL